MIPIFIGGCQRSGTTHLGAILGTNSQCLCVPESHFKTDVLRRPDIDTHDVHSLFAAAVSHWQFVNVWRLDTAGLGDLIDSQTSFPEVIEMLVRKYGETHHKPTPQFWVDHTPSNLQNAVLLVKQFPQAKFIHIVRDGRGTAASILPLDWGPNTIMDAAHWWIEAVAHGLAAETLLGSEKVHRVRYEDLVNNPEATIRGLCSFLNLDYQPGMLKGDGFKVQHYTTREHAIVGKASDSSRATAWQRTFSPRQLEYFDAIAGDMLMLLGYTPKCAFAPPKVTSFERGRSAGWNLFRDYVNRWRRHQRRHEALAKPSGIFRLPFIAAARTKSKGRKAA